MTYVTLHFTGPGGAMATVRAAEGDRLLEVAQAAGMPLEGTCEGQMACSTCHVIIASEWFSRLPPASEDEEDMLDLAAGVSRTSRLSCQIVIDRTMDGLMLHIPAESRNMQLR
ncbi:MAG: 2Fe-2S iron-sulfur cluster binding domain-containing protein [Porphyrobacter sp.]|nr:2Fe-2S iron-sulfur cluster binding domain-containing protein [Porphyrobacter sp.]